MLRKQLSREWLEGSRKRLEIAYHTSHSNPKVTMEIIMQILEELLQRLPREIQQDTNNTSTSPAGLRNASSG